MHTNYYFLSRLAEEINSTYLGYEISEIFSQEKDEVIFELTEGANQAFLKATVTTTFSCLNFLRQYARAKKNTVNLWPELKGKKLKNVKPFENERAICFEFENNFSVVFKFFGNRPNILIYDKETLIYTFNNKLLSDRDIKLSELGKHIDFSFENFQNHNGDYSKLYVTFGKTIKKHFQQNEEYQKLSESRKWEYLQDFEKKLKTDPIYIGFENGIPSLSLIPTEKNEGQFSSAIEATNAFYLFYQKDFTFANLKDIELKRLEKEVKKAENYITNSISKLDNLKNSTKNEELGHILMANLHLVKDGVEQVVLNNFYTNEDIKIRLKKELSAQKNAENYYRKSKNEKLEIESLENNLAFHSEKLESLLFDLEKIRQIEDFKELRTYIKSESQNTIQSGKPDKEDLFKCFQKDGYTIMVGKNAKNNDILTTQYAHKEDIWLHARDVSGSHVIIKKIGTQNVPNHVLEYAAGLAAYFSKRKNESLVPVMHTLKKYVRKKKGLPDGKVIVDKESTIMVKPELK
jgi:predicted ribosome quality control (RQC) complex YloA/Tae2 family protein